MPFEDYFMQQISISKETFCDFYDFTSAQTCFLCVFFFFPQFSQMSFPDDFWPLSHFPFPKVKRKNKLLWKYGLVAKYVQCFKRLTVFKGDWSVFPGSSPTGFILAAAFSLFSRACLCWQICFQGKETSAKSVPFLWEWNAIRLLSPKKTFSSKHERGKSFYYFVKGHHLARHCWQASICNKQMVFVISVRTQILIKIPSIPRRW